MEGLLSTGSAPTSLLCTPPGRWMGTAVGGERRGQAGCIVFLDYFMVCTYKVPKMEANLEEIIKIQFTPIEMVTTYTVSVLGREEGYTVKFTPLPEGIPEDKAQGNS